MVSALPGESAVASAVEALHAAAGGAARAPQVPGQSRQRVSVDEPTPGGCEGTVVTRGQLPHRNRFRIK